MTSTTFLTIKGLAKRYGVSRTTIYNWLARGLLPVGNKIGGARRWSIPELVEFEASRKEASPHA